jgi:hypothetical protein
LSHGIQKYQTITQAQEYDSICRINANKYPDTPATDLNIDEANTTRIQVARKAKNHEAIVNITLTSVE